MNFKMNNASPIVLIIMLLSNSVFAQWSFNISTYQEYASNPFRLPEPVSEIISNLNLGVQKEYESINLLYFGGYTGFSKTVERNYYWHQLGIYQEDSNSTYGAYAEQRINKSEYNFFDYFDLSAYYKYRMDYSYFIPTINFSASYKKYTNLSEYDNLFLNAGISVNKSFETKTTLILQSALNYKYYFNNYSAPVLSDPNAYQPGMGRYWSTGSSTFQIYSNLRIAQSVAENTGLAVYYTNRFLPDESAVNNTEYMLYSANESDLYDDPVSRNENSAGIELTQLLSDDLIIKTGYEYSSRKYPSQGVYINETDYNTYSVRNDEQSFFYFTFNKLFTLDEEEHYSLLLGLNYSLVDKTSNSYWYDYKNNSFSLNLSLQF